MKNTIYVLRTCNKDNKSYKGFQWPEKGHVEAPDWNPEPICGKGLHGFPRGVGDGSLANWNQYAKWLVVKVDKRKGYVEFNGKCKFKEGKVVHCVSRQEATDYLYKIYGKTLPIIGGYCIVGDGETATAGGRGTATAGIRGTATAGYRGTATAGNYGTATAGYEGTATAGDRGVATSGYRGTATAGDYGTATAGDRGTAIAGDYGTATAGYMGTATAGEGGRIQIEYYNKGKYRFANGYVGEDCIEPNVKYRCNKDGKFIKAK